MPFFATLLLNKYTLGALAVIAACAGLYFGVEHAYQKYVAAPLVAEGRAIERKDLLPTIETQAAQLDANVIAFQEIEKAFRTINENSKRLKALVVAAQKVKDARQDVEKERVVYIDKIMPVGDTECQRVDDVITKALR